MTCWKLEGRDVYRRLREALASVYGLEESGSRVRRHLYLDDFNHHIFHAGGALYRCGRRWELLVGDGCHTFDGAGRPAFVAALPPSPFRAALAPLVGVRKLEPVAELRFTTRTLVCRDRRDKVVLRIAACELPAGLVLEPCPLRGYGRHVGRAEELLRLLGATSLPEKLPRALLRASGFSPSTYRNKPAVPLTPDMPAADAVAALALANLAVARSNEPGMLRIPDDTEFLHDYRVALRRVRSLLSLLREVYPATFEDDLRRRLGLIARKTNTLRDLDVYLLDQPRFLQLLGDEFRPGLEQVYAGFARRQRAERRALREWLGSAAYEQEIAGVVAAFTDRVRWGNTSAGQSPVEQLVAAKLAMRYRKVCKRARRADAGTAQPELHRLRIQCKKLRYLLELFGDLFNRRAVAKIVDRLKSLQDCLGRINDCAAQQVTLRTYLRAAPNDNRLAMAIGAMLLALQREQDRERARLPAVIEAFAGKPARKWAGKLLSPAGDAVLV